MARMHQHAHHDKHAIHLALVHRLRTQAAEVRRLTSGLDEAALSTRSAPEKWSLKELVCHFRRMETVFGERLRAVLHDETTVIERYGDPDTDAAFLDHCRRPTDEVLAEYLSEREALCEILEKLGPAEWHRKGRHPDFPHYDVHFQVEYMAHHEAHHIYQMFQRRVPLGKLPH